MKKNDKIIIILGIVILLIAIIGIYFWNPADLKETINPVSIEEFFSISSTMKTQPDAIKVADTNPFYALIATPLAIHYDSDGNQMVKPLFVWNYDKPAKTVTRVAEEQLNIDTYLFIQPQTNLKNISLDLAKKYWDHSEGVLLIEASQEGYNQGVVATPLASYLSIPVIVTDEIDDEVREVLEDLGVRKSIVCGNLKGYKNTLTFETVEDIVNATFCLVTEKFKTVDYITLTNPHDIIEPTVLNQTSIETYSGKVSSGSFTLSHVVSIALGQITGKKPMLRFHLFDLPDYKYARVKMDIRHIIDEDVDKTGSTLQTSFLGPGNEGTWAYVFTTGGLPERNEETGGILEDRIHWETIIYNYGGEEFGYQVSAKVLTQKSAEYEIKTVIEELNSPLEPSMKKLSSMAPYLTAYHKGIIYAKPEWAFVADEALFPSLNKGNAGMVWPGCNPTLINLSNENTFKIHESINFILAKIVGINDFKGEHDLQNLLLMKQHFDEQPINICIMGGAEMVPHYYYYDTPDANTVKYGWDVASDFLYGNVDPYPRNDILQNNHPQDKFISKNSEGDNYDNYYPNQENIVGRITGWDAQDASALIARTIFYYNVLDSMENKDSWMRSALVQTGSGTDFQRLTGIDWVRKNILNAHELPFKWPTGEAHFENLMIQDAMTTGNFKVYGTETVYSMRTGIDSGVLKSMKRLGLLNFLLFPKTHINLIAGENKLGQEIHGEQDMLNSNFIFSFGHGQPMGFGHSDVQLNAIGFRPLFLGQILNRFLFATNIPPIFGCGIGNHGSYNVRYIDNMEMGPGVMLVESCYMGRIDGFYVKSLAGQTFIRSGINTYLASSRGSPGPGYLDARKDPVGLGISEYIKTTANPSLQSLHFTGLIAGDFFNELGENDATVGLAFRNARNWYMEDASTTFFWTPPLSLDIQTIEDMQFWADNIKSLNTEEEQLCMEKKYTCQLEYNLFGDPAFDPYEPANEGYLN